MVKAGEERKSMSYELTFDYRDGYLFAQVVGPEDTLEISLAYWAEIAAECAVSGVRRLLVLEQLRSNSTQADMEENIKVLGQIGFRNVRIAFVDPYEDAAMMALGEARARQAGLTGRAFRSVEEAESWLMSASPP